MIEPKEIMYSEKEVLEILYNFRRTKPLDTKNWLKQFKHKEWYNEKQTTERMNIIGQNGNDGTHY